ncbi:MAG: endonuclease/exonuclease/phosphatase family protein [Planctomycetes bacterium]|nr:endonuclease/exonuclease/phosphatase family protein [Planctomycetota bacterium]
MATFLFWNLCGRPLEPVLRRLTARHGIDVLMLAECAIPEGAMLNSLNAGGPGTFRRLPPVASQRLDLYSRFDRLCFGPVLKEADHYIIRSLTPPGGIEIVLVMAHLASPIRRDLRARHSRCIGFAQAIRDAEQAAGNDRTVVVGDLNVNPFDDAMLDVRGLNALADSRTVLRKDPRRFGRLQVEEFRLFYNPMWSHFGDAVQPAGTYYYDKSNPEVDPLWNIYDQVLLRPGLLDRFRSKNLKILTTDGLHSLTRSDGTPNGDGFSDHLPIWFQLDLRRRVRHASNESLA